MKSNLRIYFKIALLLFCLSAFGCVKETENNEQATFNDSLSYNELNDDEDNLIIQESSTKSDTTLDDKTDALIKETVDIYDKILEDR